MTKKDEVNGEEKNHYSTYGRTISRSILLSTNLNVNQTKINLLNE